MDVAAANPKVAEEMRNDRELRSLQLSNLRQLLAFSSQAIKNGAAEDPINCDELENIRVETIAAGYDKYIRKGKTAAPFGIVTPARISAFWTKGRSGPGFSDREAGFQRFLDTKISLMKRDNPEMADRTMTDAEIEAAREFYATQQIYLLDYEKRSALIPKRVLDGIRLQVRMQQAQFLARVYTGTVASKSSATEQEIAAFIATRPELNGEAKRAKAETVLRRATSGEDFAKLANEFTEDPGNLDANGVKLGGLYSGVRRGMMVAPFEKAALAVGDGQVNPAVVETDFGYHIVKLERKDDSAGGTYDVRHILFATTVPNPDDPSGRPLTVKHYARSVLESERQERAIAEVVAANDVSVPADFTVPATAPTRRSARKVPVRPVRKRR